MRDRRQRALRGSVIGGSAVLFAAASHALGGGDVPGWLAVAIGLAFAVPLGVLVAGRRPSLPRTAIVVVAAQAAFHYLFVALGSPAVVLGGHHHHAASAEGVAPVAAHAAGHASHLSDPRMAFAHLVAAALTVALIGRAETALARMLTRALVVALALVDSTPAFPHGPTARPPAAPQVLSLARRAARSLSRRGPPAVVDLSVPAAA